MQRTTEVSKHFSIRLLRHLDKLLAPGPRGVTRGPRGDAEKNWFCG
jgi:hypothetical protein